MTGVELGKASATIFRGKQEYMARLNGGQTPPPKKDYKTEYAMKNGADFASGFFFGAKVGGFDENELYKCLQKETDADEIFVTAN